MGTVCGYKAALIAADTLPKLFPMLTTAAGTITPARVLVIGAGVAGLQAIATARRLGRGSPHTICGQRPKSRSKSGRRFVELPIEPRTPRTLAVTLARRMMRFYARQRELLGRVVAEQDVVIMAAVIPARSSPVLVTREMVYAMAPGSVLVDLAAERGGNCELTRPGETFVDHDVTIDGQINLASTVPYHASQMYARNLTAFSYPPDQGPSTPSRFF